MMNLLGNIVWWIFGGMATALEYFSVGLILCLTIIGIPFGLQCFKLGLVMLFPFGSHLTDTEAKPFSCLGNILWILPGLVIALTHMIFGVILFLSIIGIPWGSKHFKFAGIALAPFGRDVEVNL